MAAEVMVAVEVVMVVGWRKMRIDRRPSGTEEYKGLQEAILPCF